MDKVVCQIPHYRHSGEQFRNRKCNPNSVVAKHHRQHNKTRHKQNQSAKQREHRRWAHSLHTLEITNKGEVDNKKHKRACDYREALHRNREGGFGVYHKHRHQLFGEQRKRTAHHRTTHHSREQSHSQGGTHSPTIATAIIEADDWLRRLSHGIAYHIHKRSVVARYAERPQAGIAQICTKYIIAHKRKHRHGALAQ